jgi:hypothetical protein
VKPEELCRLTDHQLTVLGEAIGKGLGMVFLHDPWQGFCKPEPLARFAEVMGRAIEKARRRREPEGA